MGFKGSCPFAWVDLQLYHHFALLGNAIHRCTRQVSHMRIYSLLNPSPIADWPPFADWAPTGPELNISWTFGVGEDKGEGQHDLVDRPHQPHVGWTEHSLDIWGRRGESTRRGGCRQPPRGGERGRQAVPCSEHLTAATQQLQQTEGDTARRAGTRALPPCQTNTRQLRGPFPSSYGIFPIKSPT